MLGLRPAQQALTSQLQYIEQTYFPSPAYMTLQGKPVVTNFDIDLHYTVDWTAANAALSTQPVYLFQHNSGFTHVLSDGSFSWVMPTTTDYRDGLSCDQLLRHGNAFHKRGDGRRNSTRDSNDSLASMGAESHYGPAVRPDVAADFLGNQWSVQLRETIVRAAVGDLE